MVAKYSKKKFKFEKKNKFRTELANQKIFEQSQIRSLREASLKRIFELGAFSQMRTQPGGLAIIDIGDGWLRLESKESILQFVCLFNLFQSFQYFTIFLFKLTLINH